MRTFEARRLAQAEAALQRAVRDGDGELRLQVLEAAAADMGGYGLADFQARFAVAPQAENAWLQAQGRAVAERLRASGVPPALGLSALAGESAGASERRARGLYPTDFRLAQDAVRGLAAGGGQVLDPACGAGALLVAATLRACGADRGRVAAWLRRSVHAADVSEAALRGALLALASLTDDLDAVQEMRARWRVWDSLLAPEDAWMALADGGFDAVVMNPPWEKVKLTRHEFLQAHGSERHYGSGYGADDLRGYEASRQQRRAYAVALAARYPGLGRGEPNLYAAFTRLALRLTRPQGQGVLIVPGGLIRAQGAEALRREILRSAQRVQCTVMDNRLRHFAVDGRLKFLVLRYRKAAVGGRRGRGLALACGAGRAATHMGWEALRRVRPDLTPPEVGTPRAWRLFRRMQSGARAGAAAWRPAFCREADMTHHRRHFVADAEDGCLPLVEGRMVQPHRLGCKAYVSGAGRRAVWRPLPPGQSAVRPQFHVRLAALSPEAQARAGRLRAGFCDITGQTNERSMMAAMVPPGVACGNKVPTVLFPDEQGGRCLWLWLAVVNALPFDWLMRRVVTTTINYFVLSSVRLPALTLESRVGRRLCWAAQQLARLDANGGAALPHAWRMAELRAEMDALVAQAYGCGEADLRLMLEDFPLLDRGQPALPGEGRSTVTADLWLAAWRRLRGRNGASYLRRLRAAKRAGAIPYLSAEFLKSVTEALPSRVD